MVKIGTSTGVISSIAISTKPYSYKKLVTENETDVVTEEAIIIFPSHLKKSFCEKGDEGAAVLAFNVDGKGWIEEIKSAVGRSIGGGG